MICVSVGAGSSVDGGAGLVRACDCGSAVGGGVVVVEGGVITGSATSVAMVYVSWSTIKRCGGRERKDF